MTFEAVFYPRTKFSNTYVVSAPIGGQSTDVWDLYVWDLVTLTCSP